MASRYSLSDLLQQLGIQVANMQSFYNSLNGILTAQSDSVSVTQMASDGTTSTVLVPSFGFLNGKIDNISNMFDALLNANAGTIGVVSENGDVRKFQMTDIATLIGSLENISAANVSIPTTFTVKNNWFFENFMDPLLTLPIDVSLFVSNDIDSFEVHRVIVNDSTTDISNYFDTTYKANNAISYSDLILDLTDRGITYNEAVDVYSLPLAVNKNRGTFDVLSILSDTVAEVVNGLASTNTITKYQLNTLKYTNTTLSQVPNTVLAINDVLITSDNAEYQITSLDKTSNTVILNLIFGTQGITQGAAQLRILPVPFRTPTISATIGFNERQVIFIRPISSQLELTTDSLSNGFGIFSNDLNIVLDDGSSTTLDSFYSNFVSDFGLMFISFAKDKKIPAVLGAIPNAPVVDVSNFTVSQIDQHITNTSNTNQIKSQLSSKEQLKTQMDEIDTTVTNIKASLNTNKSLSASQKLKLQTDLTTNTNTKTTLFNQYSTTVKQISLAVQTTPSFIVPPTYAVRGFWQPPAPQVTDYGTQTIVQYRVRYRYLSAAGTAANAQPITYTDSTGTTRTGFFSPYVEFLTEPLKKAIDPTTGNMAWQPDNTADPTVINSNQLEIPIRKGESVEISIASVSEAGYPENPVLSVYSTPITVPFPADIQTAEEATITSQKLFAEESQVDFTNALTAKGLDLHLQGSFTNGDKYYAHSLSDLASGFFDASGTIIDAFTQIQNMIATLTSIQTSLATAAGQLLVQILDTSGNTFTVINGKTINLFAGNYHDMIKNSITNLYNEGQIVSADYTLSIQNTSATTLELVSYLMGGIGQVPPISFPASAIDADYGKNRRYDKVPLTMNSLTAGNIAGITQQTGLQSSQVQSQFLYLRYMNFALANQIYDGDNVDTTAPTSSTNPRSYTVLSAYNFLGRTLVYGGNSDNVPFNFGHYLPYDPNISTIYVGVNPVALSSDANVWNGTFTTNVANGNGPLSEFCIHKNHPGLTYLGFDATTGANLAQYFRPKYTVSQYNTGTQIPLPFAEALHSDTSIDDKIDMFGSNYYVQAEYVTPTDPGLTNAQNSLLLTEQNYPIRIGYAPNDSFLVGKRTCGCYLFVMPNDYTTISVQGNHPTLSQMPLVTGPANAINIPIVFQFRCSDALGYVGGFRTSGPITNIKYGKTIGFDIYIQGQSTFSFDVNVTCQYKQDTNTTTNLVSDTGSQSVISA